MIDFILHALGYILVWAAAYAATVYGCYRAGYPHDWGILLVGAILVGPIVATLATGLVWWFS